MNFSAKTRDKAHTQGAAIVAENPRNAYCWLFKSIINVLGLLGVFILEYMACAFAGARSKKQSLMTNVEELRTMASVCRHIHDAHEWDRTQMPNGRYEYPTAEEAEFTAEFAFGTAVRLSYWAVRMGRAKLKLARHPIMPTETGRRDIMLKLPPSATRSEAMIGMGLRLGLDPPASIAHNIPRLRSLAAGIDPTSMKHAVYVGNGSAKCKLPAAPSRQLSDLGPMVMQQRVYSYGLEDCKETQSGRAPLGLSPFGWRTLFATARWVLRATARQSRLQ